MLLIAARERISLASQMSSSKKDHAVTRVDLASQQQRSLRRRQATWSYHQPWFQHSHAKPSKRFSGEFDLPNGAEPLLHHDDARSHRSFKTQDANTKRGQCSCLPATQPRSCLLGFPPLLSTLKISNCEKRYGTHDKVTEVKKYLRV